MKLKKIKRNKIIVNTTQVLYVLLFDLILIWFLDIQKSISDLTEIEKLLALTITSGLFAISLTVFFSISKHFDNQKIKFQKLNKGKTNV